MNFPKVRCVTDVIMIHSLTVMDFSSSLCSLVPLNKFNLGINFLVICACYGAY